MGFMDDAERLGAMAGATYDEQIALGRFYCEGVIAGQMPATPAGAKVAREAFVVSANNSAGIHYRPISVAKPQPSKLLRFGKLADEFGASAILLLNDIEDVYNIQIWPIPGNRARIVENGRYNSMVRVIRRALHWHRLPSKQEIFDIITSTQPRLSNGGPR
jgi:hypothetical protein